MLSKITKQDSDYLFTSTQYQPFLQNLSSILILLVFSMVMVKACPLTFREFIFLVKIGIAYL